MFYVWQLEWLFIYVNVCHFGRRPWFWVASLIGPAFLTLVQLNLLYSVNPVQRFPMAPIWLKKIEVTEQRADDCSDESAPLPTENLHMSSWFSSLFVRSETFHVNSYVFLCVSLRKSDILTCEQIDAQSSTIGPAD